MGLRHKVAGVDTEALLSFASPLLQRDFELPHLHFPDYTQAFNAQVFQRK